jgi:hypothetical protein
MNIEKIEINEDGDYNIKYNNKLIRRKGVIVVYISGKDLTNKLNTNIIELLESDDCIHTKYKEPVLPFEQLKADKLFELRSKRDNVINVGDTEIGISDIMMFVPLLLLDDTKKNSKLPIETPSGLMIENIETLENILELYVDHIKLYSQKINDCEKTKTKSEVEAITV